MDETQLQTFSALPTAFFAASRLRAGEIILPYGSALLLASSILLSALPSAAAVITVGPVGADYTRVSDAIANADPNDEIQIATGLYVDDYATIEIPLTISGIGATPVLQAVSPIPSGKGIFVVRADVLIRNLEFRDAKVPDNNGAGIRLDLGDLTVEGSIFRHNQMGILTNSYAGGDVVVRGSDFVDNGVATGPKIGHAVYANHIDSLLVEHSRFSGQQIGHDIKSRALKSTILDNVLDDGMIGTSSYAIDLPNGGAGIIDGNAITQGPTSPNRIMIAYGGEGSILPGSSLLVRCNMFSSDGDGATGVMNFTTDVIADLRGNTFTNVPTPLAGPGTISDDTCVEPAAVPEPPK
jgi:hypothetical protein